MSQEWEGGYLCAFKSRRTSQHIACEAIRKMMIGIPSGQDPCSQRGGVVGELREGKILPSKGTFSGTRVVPLSWGICFGCFVVRSVSPVCVFSFLHCSSTVDAFIKNLSAAINNQFFGYTGLPLLVLRSFPFSLVFLSFIFFSRDFSVTLHLSLRKTNHTSRVPLPLLIKPPMTRRPSFSPSMSLHLMITFRDPM